MPFRKIAAAILCLASALSIAPPALAQSEPPPPGEEGAGPDTSELHIPGYERPPRRAWLELEVAPELVSHNPLGSSSRASDETNVSLTFITRQPLSSGLELEFDAGPSTTIDTDNDTPFESSLAASLELRTRPGASGFSSFLSYAVARDFDDFFGEGLETSQTLTAGLRYGGKAGPVEIGFELAPRWVNSTRDLDDYLAGELWMEGVAPVGNEINLIAEGIVDRRWYQNANPAIGGKRRDWRFEAFLGLDFAGAVARGEGSLLRSLGLGMRWIEVNSNLDSADRSSFKLLPAITLRLGL